MFIGQLVCESCRSRFFVDSDMGQKIGKYYLCSDCYDKANKSRGWIHEKRVLASIKTKVRDEMENIKGIECVMEDGKALGKRCYDTKSREFKENERIIKYSNRKIICKICGTEFVSSCYRAKYCSDKCRSQSTTNRFKAITGREWSILVEQCSEENGYKCSRC